MSVWSAVCIMGLCAVGGVVTEVVGYKMLYSKDSYTSAVALQGRLLRAAEKLEAKRQRDPSKVSEKQVAQARESIKEAARSLSMKKMGVMFVNALLMFALFWVITSVFSGTMATLKLPFAPIGIIQGLSHMGLDGNDLTDCSASFVYALASMSLRTYVVRLLGLSPADEGGAAAAILGDEWDLSETLASSGNAEADAAAKRARKID